MKNEEKNGIISLKPLFFKGADQVGIYFDYEKQLAGCIKKLDGCDWSSTHRCWYTAYTDKKLKQLIFLLGNYGIIENYIDKNTELLPGKSTENIPAAENRKALEQFRRWLRAKAYAPATTKMYTAAMFDFLNFPGIKIVPELSAGDILRFNREAIITPAKSPAYQHRFVHALSLFFRSVFGKNILIPKLDKPKRKVKPPVILTKSEMEKLLKSAGTLKQKVLILLVNSCKLKIRQVLELKVKDIDTERMALFVQGEKRSEGRLLPVFPDVCDVIRLYCNEYSPVDFLVEGKAGKKYSERSAQQMLEELVKRSKIRKKITYHALQNGWTMSQVESGRPSFGLQKTEDHKNTVEIEMNEKVSLKTSGSAN